MPGLRQDTATRLIMIKKNTVKIIVDELNAMNETGKFDQKRLASIYQALTNKRIGIRRLIGLIRLTMSIRTDIKSKLIYYQKKKKKN